jgi:hypothetical protein
MTGRHGAAGARHKQDSWPLAALVVVDVPAPIFDHGISNLSLVTVFAGWPEPKVGWLNRSAIRVVLLREMNALSV